MKRGNLIILSGPSGVGKGTIKDQLLMDPSLNLHYSVSCTTREPRDGEIDGVHYYFISQEQFDQMIQEDAFLEYARFVDHSYGTPAKVIEEKRQEGKNVLLEIELQGALQVISKCPDALSIFILPPSLEELEKRLSGRGTESAEVVQKRLETAKQELAMQDHYQYRIVNDTVARAVQEITKIIKDHSH